MTVSYGTIASVCMQSLVHFSVTFETLPGKAIRLAPLHSSGICVLHLQLFVACVHLQCVCWESCIVVLFWCLTGNPCSVTGDAVHPRLTIISTSNASILIHVAVSTCSHVVQSMVSRSNTHEGRNHGPSSQHTKVSCKNQGCHGY